MVVIQRRNPRQLDTIGKTMFVEADEEYEAEVAERGLDEEIETHTGA